MSLAPESRGAPATGSTSDEPLLVSDSGGVRTITLRRPAAYNAFDLELKGLFLSALTAAAADEAVRTLVITGSGRAFSAGQDLKEHLALVQAADPRVASTVRDFYNVAVVTITDMPKPVIAAVNGAAAGAGAGLAFACDLRIAARSASFSMAFAGVALSADTGASYTLPRLVGAGRASAMMLLGGKVDAVEALRIGMVGQVVDDQEFPAAVAELAARLADGPTRAYAWIKASLHRGASGDLAAALDFEERAQAELFAGQDHHEAIRAFSAKVPPRFQGR